ncbi:RNA polymerase, sigma 28 subunit [Rubrobacter xylanophilus DSM 9941]|uniref:RNA polymerase, sigma 28 subunit n=2 Tax=Rubrobacter xylanophilus TaxID=49319 RepID=Q1AY85_RUBXD|nr:RNA polymerase, sigma 28 subunit [Rubrobacter xylanophilus DSM 9941]
MSREPGAPGGLILFSLCAMDGTLEQALLERAASGDREARRRVIESHLGLAAALARRYARRWVVPFEDLLQEGALALVHAVDHYDPSRGMRFSTYATWWVKQAIRRAAMAYARPMRVPERTWRLSERLAEAERELRAELGREIEDRDLRSGLGWSEEELSEVRRAMGPVVSLESPVGEEEEDVLGDLVADENAEDPAELAARNDARRRLAHALSALPRRERAVLAGRYGLTGEPRTFVDLGRELGVSRERARQLERAAAERLREHGRRLGLEPSF